MDSNRISHILDFVDDVVCEEARQQVSEINFVLDLTSDVRQCIELNRHLSPYHLNIIITFCFDFVKCFAFFIYISLSAKI